MNVLLLTHRVPYPPNRGDRIRSYQLLRFLAARYEVSLGCLAEEPVESETMSELRRLTRQFRVVPQHRQFRWVRAALSFAAGGTATSGLFASNELARTVRRWGTETRFDCVIAFCSSMATYAFLPELEGVPVFIDLVDVDSQKWLDYADKSRGIKRWLYRAEGHRLRQWESRLNGRATGLVLVSQAEAELFRDACPDARAMAITNGVDTKYFQPAEAAATCRPRSCVFVGALDYGANVDAVRWFCEHVWLMVLERHPDAQLAIVGRRPTSAVQSLACLPGVTIAADVSDVRPYLEEAEVSIAPLRIARGIQNKVLEAMAMGKAVLASPGALAGIDISPGVHALQAETPDQWRRSLENLWASNRVREELGAKAREYVLEHHCWESTLSPWEKLIETAIVSSGRAEVVPLSATRANGPEVGSNL